MDDNRGQDIYRAAITCSGLFQTYLTASVTSEPRRNIADELCGRFNLWAAYTGAFASPKASLDARLADHEDIKDMVLELLVMVERNIRYGKHISILLTNPVKPEAYQSRALPK